MGYASRVCCDADSHIMETLDWVTRFADPDIRDRLPPLVLGAAGNATHQFISKAEARVNDPERTAAIDHDVIGGPKGWAAYGAFDIAERKRALDDLGFQRQLVFSTFAGTQYLNATDPDLLYGGIRAHNRAMGEFCASDRRLHGVGLLPLDVTALSLIELDNLLKQGLKAAWIPHRPCGGRSPGHSDLDPIWARLAEAGVPFVLHVGGHPLQIAPEWMNTGRKVPTDWLGGGENVRGKDMTSLHQAAETFIGTMVLDGVLERHPGLRGGVIELGAGWVPQMLTRLDWVVEIWKKSEPELAALKRKPSEQIIAQLAFTPFVYENVGELIRQSDERLYLFSSDYPHTEGGRAPLARFEASLMGHDESAKDHFYSRNFARLFEAA